MQDQTVQSTPERFLELMIQLETQNKQFPRLGTAFSASQEPFRLGSQPHLEFVPLDVVPAEKVLKDPHHPPPSKPFYAINNFGLWGPNGALPLHLTEYALTRARHYDDHSLIAFLDQFHHRFFQLFYRAWSESRPEAPWRSEDGNPFYRRMLDLAGHGIQPWGSAGGGRSRMRMAMSASLNDLRRSAEQTARGLQAAFGWPVKIQEFQGQWLTLDAGDQTVLGESRKGLGGLPLGRKVWDLQSRLTVEVGPLKWADFESLWPEGERHAQFCDGVKAMIGLEYDWRIELRLRACDVPDPQLGRQVRLGRSAFLKRPGMEGVLKLRPSARTVPPGLTPLQPIVASQPRQAGLTH